MTQETVDSPLVDSHLLLKGFRKTFGESSIFILGDNEKFDIKVRSSGSLLLDIALGGGYAHGRLVEFRGPERSGKSSLLSLAIAQAQLDEPEKENMIIDTEHAFSLDWAEKLGMNSSKIFFSQPDTYAERVYDLIEEVLRSKRFAIIGIDSIAGLVPKSELEESDWEKESRVGGMSKINSMAMRKLVNSGLLTDSGSTLVFINQIRDKIGGFSMYGTPTDTPGGRSIKFAYTHTLDVAVGDHFTKGTGTAKETLGQQLKVKVVKNKIAPPLRTAALDLYYAHGVDRITELINVAKIVGVLAGSTWLKVVDPVNGEAVVDAGGNEIKYNGASKFREALVEDVENNNGEVYSKILSLVNQTMRGD